MKPFALLAGCLLVTSTPLAAQTVPDDAGATRVPLEYRRSPSLRIDPFRSVLIPRWGFAISAGGLGENNALNFDDLGALLFLGDRDSLLVADAVDALGLVPRGAGVGGLGRVEAGVHVGGPMTRRFGLGVGVQTRSYGTLDIDDRAVALLRDGNLDQTEFGIGRSNGAVLSTLEPGVHAVIRLGPVGSGEGVHLALGIGARYVWPLYFGQARSLIDSREAVRVTSDSIIANVAVEKAFSTSGEATGFDAGDFLTTKGHGLAVDLLVRAVWPKSGIAVEAMVANLGRVRVRNVERSDWSFNVATTRLEEVLDSLDAFPDDLFPDSTGIQFRSFRLRDTVEVALTLPPVARVTMSAWANAVLQLDAAATLPVGGVFDTPLVIDFGSTWRAVPVLPLRLGLVLGGHQGLGYVAGVGIESRHLVTQLQAGSLGGLFGRATGLAGRLDVGVFF